MVLRGFALLAAFIVVACHALAQTEPKPNPAASTAPAAADQPKKIPDNFKLNMMIRSTVIAVNQANKTRNYTVLRDLGSPKFKAANSAEKLANVFESLRKAKFDLSPVLFFTPKLLQLPALTEDDMLRLTGFFETQPQRVAFDLLFEDVKGEWLIYGINIATQPAPVTGAQSAPLESATPSEKK